MHMMKKVHAYFKISWNTTVFNSTSPWNFLSTLVFIELTCEKFQRKKYLNQEKILNRQVMNENQWLKLNFRARGGGATD